MPHAKMRSNGPSRFRRKTKTSSKWLAVLPATAVLAIGGGASYAFGSWLALVPSPLLPHLSLVASFITVLYVLTAFVFGQPNSEGVGRYAVGVVSFTSFVALLSFYILTVACLMLLRDFPTYELVVSYADEVPVLVSALPVSKTMVAVAVVALVGVLVAAAFCLSACLISSGPFLSTALTSGTGRVWARTLGYGATGYLILAFTVPMEWHIASREPFTATRYSLHLATQTQYAQRNPVESALDRSIEESFRRLSAAHRPNVVLIYVDALRADVTQPYGGERKNMPFISDMVRRGELQQVDFGLANCSATICGLGAILQSRSTKKQSPENFSLPRLLSGQGYKTAYVLSSNHQGYFDLKKYYEPIDFYVDGRDLDVRRSTDDYLLLLGLDRLGHWTGEPTFLMMGLVSPHPIALKRDDNRRYLPDQLSFVASDETFQVAYRNNYENGVLQADDVLRRTWEKLSELGYVNDDTVVVITSDHGESLGERGIYGHVKTLFNTELRIPIWIRTPQRGVRNLRFARQTDIAPTIVDVLGLPKPSSWQGTSLFLDEPTEWSDHYLSDKPHQIAVVQYSDASALKYLFDGETGIERVFDLLHDPHELKDLSATIPEGRARLLRQRATTTLRAR